LEIFVPKNDIFGPNLTVRVTVLNGGRVILICGKPIRPPLKKKQGRKKQRKAKIRLLQLAVAGVRMPTCDVVKIRTITIAICDQMD
jgi:hypothetical protein